VDLADLKACEEHLYDKLMSSPLEMVKIMEDTVRSFVKECNAEFRSPKDCEWQINLRSDEISTKLRNINSNMVYKLFVINGIIISATKPYIKATKLKLKCRNCMATKVIDLAPGQMPYIPAFC
jgi:DNA replicative helicase MCM subunit Mcm2 (Cdc46/Mcm family)